jgi:hypothetical protein
MKLRIQGNSLRLRITPSEMTHLLANGRIEETVCFGSDPNASLTYALEHNTRATAMSVRYTPGEVTVILSSADAQQWAGGQDVGVYAEAATTQGVLSLAVEKDFACLDKSDADNRDTFPNPNQGSVC